MGACGACPAGGVWGSGVACVVIGRAGAGDIGEFCEGRAGAGCGLDIVVVVLEQCPILLDGEIPVAIEGVCDGLLDALPSGATLCLDHDCFLADGDPRRRGAKHALVTMGVPYSQNVCSRRKVSSHVRIRLKFLQTATVLRIREFPDLPAAPRAVGRFRTRGRIGAPARRSGVAEYRSWRMTASRPAGSSACRWRNRSKNLRSAPVGDLC